MTTEATNVDTDAVVIGAGFAGIYMVYRLREAGFDVRGFEAAGDVGGTWYWNRYPGCRCDSETFWYSYSFLEDIEQEWQHRERYPGQPEILRYLERVADHLDVRKHFTFNVRVESMTYDHDEALWTVRTSDGGVVRARWVITGLGCLSAANDPQIEGQESFAGLLLHTGNWPHEPVDFSGKRVGVIGTGASGIQIIPKIAEDAGSLTVFQRTAQYTLPAANGPLSDELIKMWKQNYREWRRRGRLSFSGAPVSPPLLSALDVTPDERRAAFESSWEAGGYVFTSGTFNDILRDPIANETAADFVRAKIDEIVDDPEVAEMLKPKGYPIAAKRIPLDTNYYATYNRPNVRLVDLKRTPIECITPEGVQTSDQLHELDILVYATGFDAITGPLLKIDIRGKDGLSLRDAWADGPTTYLGLAVPEFPNLFTITGPGSPSVLGTVPVTIEQNVEWIGDLLVWARDNGVQEVEASEDAAENWTAHVQELANQTLYPTVSSWYTGGNIEGKPRAFMPYVGGYSTFEAKCNEIAEHGYEGFELRSPSRPAPWDKGAKTG